MWQWAVAAACLAIAVGCLGALGTSPPPVSDVGQLLFAILGAEVTRFALPFAFSRFALPASDKEHIGWRLFWAAVVGSTAFVNHRLWDEGAIKHFAIVLVTQAISYLFMRPLLPKAISSFGLALALAGLLAGVIMLGRWYFFVRGILGAACAWLSCQCAAARSTRTKVLLAFCAAAFGILLAPYLGFVVLQYLLPLEELRMAYVVVAGFVGSEQLGRRCTELLLVTVNVQVPLGYLGIGVLRKSQARKNDLLRVGEGQFGASVFVRRAAVFVFMAAVPYMLQRTIMENINSYEYGRFARDVERALRVELLFPRGQDTILGAVTNSDFTVESFSESLDTIVAESYSIVERKLFSLPKLALLPGMLWRKPVLVATVIPGSIALDFLKSQLTALVSGMIESFNREMQELADRRRRVEQHDTKSEELIRRAGAGGMVRVHWRELTSKFEGRALRYGALRSVRTFIEWLYWQDIMTPGLECALSFLLEIGHITNVDIWVYQRAIEDAIDTLLTRSRAQAELATMAMHLERLEGLSSSIDSIRDRGRAQCEVDSVEKRLWLTEVQYSRGSSLRISIPELSLSSGRAYAVTGANGCGKSTIFGILSSCGRRSTTLPIATELEPGGRIVLPSDDVVEITQQLYCPLFTRPIAWLLQLPEVELPSEEVLAPHFERVRRLSLELRFHGGNASEGLSQSELYEEKEDWCSELSGGQRVKVELMRKVFLKSECPGVLLLDEAFAPLDPDSKASVQLHIKEACASSLVLAIMHTDAGESCVRGGGFFDGNLHFENNTAQLVDTC